MWPYLAVAVGLPAVVCTGLGTLLLFTASTRKPAHPDHALAEEQAGQVVDHPPEVPPGQGQDEGLPDWFPAPGPEQGRRRQERREWLKQTLSAAYERCGRKSPRWDAAAREALQAAEDFFYRTPDAERRAWRAARAAHNAGCDDPLIQYLYVALADDAGNVPQPEQRRLSRDVAAAMGRSAYPAVRRGRALLEAVRQAERGEPEDRKAIRPWLDAAAGLLPEILRDPNLEARHEAYILAGNLLNHYRDLDGDRQAGFRKVDGILQQCRAPEASCLWVKGIFALQYAWDTRGPGFARDVTPEGWRLYDVRLHEAEADLTRAGELDPTNPLIARDMILAARHLNYRRDEMEVWFRRAVRADADCWHACEAKLNYLHPKWHGDRAAMLAFGHECVRTRNWHDRLPFILVEAHRELARWRVRRAEFDRVPANQRPSATQYYQEPSVWKDLQSVYIPYLERHPESRRDRTRYAKQAFYCGQYAEADRQFQLLGEEYWEAEFGSPAAYRQVRDFCAQAAGGKPPPAPAEKPPPPRPPDTSSVTLEAVNQAPAKYQGRVLEFQALLSGTVVTRGDVYELQVFENGLHPTNLDFTTTREVALGWSAAGVPFAGRWVRLVGRIEQVNPVGRSKLHVTQVALLNDKGEVERVFPPA
jgi:hypothetical protein